MHCRKCQCDEISADGICLWCGNQVTGAAPDSADEPDGGRYISDNRSDIVHSADEPAREELPQWRQELSQRLRSIKKKRESSKAPVRRAPAASPHQNSEMIPLPESEIRVPQPGEAGTGRANRGARRRATRSNNIPVALPLAAPVDGVAAEQDAAYSAVAPSPAAAIEECRKVADQSMAQAIEATPQIVPAEIFRSSIRTRPEEGRFVLVFRALSGLLDLLIMVLCTGAVIVAADLISGMKFWEYSSIIRLSLLFILVYFAYSILFLGLSNQTIGMMMMKLHVVDRDQKRPQFCRMLARNCGYIASIACAGIGLIWAFFDWDRQCLHDRLSGTRVVQVE